MSKKETLLPKNKDHRLSGNYKNFTDYIVKLKHIGGIMVSYARKIKVRWRNEY